MRGEYDNLDDGQTPPGLPEVGAAATPLFGPSFMPKVWFTLLVGAILLSIAMAIAAPPAPERPAADEPWTPSSGPCAGLSAWECKWN